MWLALLASEPARAGIALQIVNRSGEFNDNQVYAQFWSGSLNGTHGGSALATNTNYTVAALNAGGGTTLNSYVGGRLFFSVGKPIDNPGGAQPQPLNSSVSSYSQRWDDMELTLADAFGVANLTTIDLFGVALEINTLKNGVVQEKLTFTPAVPNTAMVSLLAAASGNSASARLVDSTTGDLLRILGPSLAPDAYGSFSDYLQHIKTWQSSDGGHATHIAGHYFGGDASQPPERRAQDYSFTATIDAAGNLILTGSGTAAGSHTLKIAAADLNNQGIYGSDPLFSVDGGTPHHNDNTVYATALRDYLAALNFGFVASKTIDPATGVAFGDEPSDQWWKSPQAFNFLQPEKPFYNEWAKVVHDNSQSYGTPYSDVWTAGKVQASLDPAEIDTLQVVILPFRSNSSDPGGNLTVPEPGSLALWTFMSLTLVVIARGRVGRRPAASR